MTTYDSGAGLENPYGTGYEGQIPRLSGLAIAALVCALLFCVPVLPLIGVVLGLIALVTMVGKSHLRGRGMAIAAIVLGLAISIAQGIGVWFFVGVGTKVMALMRDTPIQTMRAGLAGDIAGFKANFDGTGASASDAEAQAFLNEVSQRFGTLTSMELDPAAPPRQQGQAMMEGTYIAKFSNGDVRANVELVIMDPKTGSFIYKLGAIEFVDAQRGNLRFPPLPKAPGGAPVAPPPSSPTSTPPATSGTP